MSQADEVRDLLAQHGRTFATDAGITLRDTPSPLFRLLVLTLLASTRISADVAVATARELSRAGWRTPRRMLESTWQQRVDALGRGGYRRYDETTATRLEALCIRLVEDYRGDLRVLRPDSAADVDRLRKGLTGFTGIGPVGADIFCREVQAVWPTVGPFFDRRALAGARARGLPVDPARLAALAPDGRVANLAAALVRVA
ncbi:endonuclease [Phycicoccus flavus]|uniref:endonuclease n=1 Tax=Phycicoccus flavus TaxID=2502783 RepID=UPI000FEB9FB7|nr:endonuclease [Phycicoccus flavus]NHA67337.1 endonuclease [Phycicoccus flavus]